VAVLGGIRYVDLTNNEQVNCAVTAAGDVWCWGGNTYGEFGDGMRFTGSSSPVAAASGQKFQSISAGEQFLCGIGMDQRVYCWGSNSTGVIGPVCGATPQPVLLNVSLAGL
jgi:alpha-tubulin suppressor-like RCC1 family protein